MKYPNDYGGSGSVFYENFMVFLMGEWSKEMKVDRVLDWFPVKTLPVTLFPSFE